MDNGFRSTYNPFVAAPLRHFGIGNFPDEVYRFSVPKAGIRRWDDEALVYDVRLDGESALRHYAFYDRWFVVNVSLDARTGSLVTERSHGLDWCFNCDMPLLAPAARRARYGKRGVKL